MSAKSKDETELIYVSGANKEQRKLIREGLDSFVESLMKKTNLSGEAMALEIRYWHQLGSNKFRTTSIPKDKKKSWRHHQGKCQASAGCSEPLDFNEAVFHHDERGIEDQHSPLNLKPFHSKCHDLEHHDKVSASMSKGSPKKRVV